MRKIFSRENWEFYFEHPAVVKCLLYSAFNNHWAYFRVYG